MTTPASHSWLVKGSRREQLRVRPASRDSQPIVRLDILEPLAAHVTTMTVIGRPVCVPLSEVDALCDALKAASAAAQSDSNTEGAR